MRSAAWLHRFRETATSGRADSSSANYTSPGRNRGSPENSLDGGLTPPGYVIALRCGLGNRHSPRTPPDPRGVRHQAMRFRRCAAARGDALRIPLRTGPGAYAARLYGLAAPRLWQPSIAESHAGRSWGLRHRGYMISPHRGWGKRDPGLSPPGFMIAPLCGWVPGSSRGMRHARVGGWGGEEGLVGDAGADGFGHVVVDLQDDPLGAVLAVRGLVFLPDDGEGVEDVGGVVAVDAVEVEEGGVQLAAEQEPAGARPSGTAGRRSRSRGRRAPGPRRCRSVRGRAGEARSRSVSLVAHWRHGSS